MTNPNQLFLLSDHVKLSLLERQRAQSLELDSDTQDGHISRSLDQFRDGLASLRKQKDHLDQAATKAAPKPSPTPSPRCRSSSTT
jgi:syntaxin 8